MALGPKKTASTRKDARLLVTMTKDERKKLAILADEDARSLAGWLRSAVVKAWRERERRKQ